MRKERKSTARIVESCEKLWKLSIKLNRESLSKTIVLEIIQNFPEFSPIKWNFREKFMEMYETL